MAAAFPDVVRSALDAADDAAGGRLAELRSAMEASGQFIAAAKHVIGARGVPVMEGMRGPLRTMTEDERRALEAAVTPFLAATPV